MPVINQVAAADTYAATNAVIQGVYHPKGGWFSVGSFPAYVQLQYALPGTRTGLGNYEWKDEELVGAGAFGFIPGDAIGIRFRNANAGSNAVITASLSQGPEPALAIVALGNVTTSGRAPTRTYLTAAGGGNYVPPAAAVAILVECIGGGGAGGGAPATNAASVGVGQGGQSGGYAAKLIGSPAAAGYAYTVGAGGTGVAGGNGNAGQATTFGAGPLISAAGGAGGVQTSTAAFPSVQANPQAGAVPTVGDLLIQGGVGGAALALSLTMILTGSGGDGSGPEGGGGGPGISSSAAGNNGAQGGGGGGGAGNLASQAVAKAGGNGGTGIIVVTEFY